MPKQRNHPHHHSSVWRARRQGGLRLPQLGWGLRSPYYEYPPGWIMRSPWKTVVRLYLTYAVVAVIFVATLMACAGGVALWQTFIGSR